MTIRKQLLQWRTQIHDQRRRLHERFIHHPYVVPISIFLLMVIMGSIGFVSFNAQTVGASDSRVVSIFVDDQERIIPTRAATVGELLDKMNLSLREEDSVEPSKDTPILEDNFRINITRARIVTILDKGKKYRIFTADRIPHSVAQKAGLELFPEDEVVEADNTSDSVVSDGVIGEKLQVLRAKPVVLNLYGNELQLRTKTATVEQLLKEKEITPAKTDVLEPALTTALTEGMTISLTNFDRKVVTVDEVLAAPEERVNDANLAKGKTEVREQGADGKRVVTYEIKLVNNQETERNILQESIVSQPVRRLIAVGTKVSIPANSPIGTSDVVALGQQIANELGWGGQFSCINNIFTRESGWNTYAINRSSGAYGIPQALPGSKMGPGWESDPAVQIRWGINYMAGRYGSPCGAWNFWTVNHWY